jgi:hypothetical protein
MTSEKYVCSSIAPQFSFINPKTRTYKNNEQVNKPRKIVKHKCKKNKIKFEKRGRERERKKRKKGQERNK